VSRIHEALKRAEREKGRAPAAKTPAEPASVAPKSPAPAPPPSSSGGATPVAAALAAATASAPASLPIAVPLTDLPAQLASCRRAHWHEDASKLLFLSGRAPVFATEQLRALRSRLYQFRETRPLKSVLVTSAMPGEGKSFICSNLAYAFARQSDKRVLLLDADLRAPSLHTFLGAPRDPGLSAYLRGEAGLEQILQRGPHENLFLIPAGRPAQNAADLVAGGKLKGLLAEASPLFDWILLDSPAVAGSPAVAPVSDALEIAGWCDGVLLVVEGGKTPYDLAQNVTRSLGEKRLLGVVLNRTDPSSAIS